MATGENQEYRDKAAAGKQLKLKLHTVLGPDPLRVDPSPEDAPVPTKIHVMCLSVDQRLFGQMRSPDLMHYFRAYAPVYVEWLGERSLNVHFADE